MQFEWDPPKKSSESSHTHCVSFAEAQTVFGDPLQWTVRDPDRSTGEFRFLTTGLSNQAIIIVAHTDRADRIRIISARRVTAAERRVYEEGQ